ncbi:MAG: hypothetical protein WCP69_15605 [Bacteroidota bacterium]
MTLKQNFLHPDLKTFEVSKFRIIVGVIIGIFYSFAFYSFQFVLREAFRTLSVNEDYDLWILSTNEVHFYNLFFAFISVIIGQSICFTYWFDRPNKRVHRLNYKRTSILNDQRVLNWYFLFWFLKMTFLYALFFGLSSGLGSQVFSFYPDYIYLFILIIVVLYLQTWNTIRQLFKQRSTKWLLISIVVVSLTSFGLSRINIVDYEAINKICNQKNIHYNYNLELPESDFYEKLEKRSLIENIYIVERKKQIGKYEPVILIDKQEVKLSDLYQKIKEKQFLREESDIPFMVYQLHIHRKIKMSFVRELKQELSDANVQNIAYSVTPTNSNNKHCKNCVSRFRLQPQNSILFPPPLDFTTVDNIIEITYSGKTYSINKKKIDFKDFKDEIKKQIQSNLHYIIKLYISEDDNFEVYLNTIICIKKAVFELRDEYCLEKFAKHFDDIEDTYEIRKKYRLTFIEMTPEMTEQLK